VDTTDADQDAVRIALEYCNVTRTHAVVVLGFNLAFVLFFSIGFFYRHQDTVFFSMSAASAIVVIVCNALGVYYLRESVQRQRALAILDAERNAR
jgi:hypothetical protein